MIRKREDRLRVLFAPDYRAGNPYQNLLATALSERGIDVEFLNGYRRGLPLYRGSSAIAPDIVHLHWPEAYFAPRGDRWDRFRVMRHPLDCWLTARRHPVVVTAHNLLPHNRSGEPSVFRSVQATLHTARAVFVHSRAARTKLARTFAVPDERIVVIPFGDHSAHLGAPISREKARNALRLPQGQKICLMFGTVSPYKGIAEILRFWNAGLVRHQLCVVGPVVSQAYATLLGDLAGDNPAVDLRLRIHWLDDAELCIWLSAADCAIFNYQEIFTSGAAALARSFGLPLLVPRHATTLDLGEPHSHVVRFESVEVDFRDALEHALAARPDYAKAEEWRDQTSWRRVAEATGPIYRSAVLEA